jgi:hypothetical protein
MFSFLPGFACLLEKLASGTTWFAFDSPCLKMLHKRFSFSFETKKSGTVNSWRERRFVGPAHAAAGVNF